MRCERPVKRCSASDEIGRVIDSHRSLTHPSAHWSAPLKVDRDQAADLQSAGFSEREPMAKHRNHSIEFERQVAQEFIAGPKVVSSFGSG